MRRRYFCGFERQTCKLNSQTLSADGDAAKCEGHLGKFEMQRYVVRNIQTESSKRLVSIGTARSKYIDPLLWAQQTSADCLIPALMSLQKPLEAVQGSQASAEDLLAHVRESGKKLGGRWNTDVLGECGSASQSKAMRLLGGERAFVSSL